MTQNGNLHICSRLSFESKKVEIPGSSEEEVTVDVALDPIEVIVKDDEVVLNPIFFEFDKSNITAQAAFELDKLVQVMNKYPDISKRQCIHEVIRRMINQQVTDLISSTSERLGLLAIATVNDVRNCSVPVIGFSDEMREKNHLLKRFLRKNLYRNYRVHRMSHKAQQVVKSLFETFFDDPRLLPPDFQLSSRKCRGEGSDQQRARVVADYIAGMTDRFAIAEYERLFNPNYLT